jgi:hypothetical protein
VIVACRDRRGRDGAPSRSDQIGSRWYVAHTQQRSANRELQSKESTSQARRLMIVPATLLSKIRVKGS